MQIHHSFQSNVFAPNLAETRLSTVEKLAGIAADPEAEIAGNARFPSLDKTEASAQAGSRDTRDETDASGEEEKTQDALAQTENSDETTLRKQEIQEERREIAELSVRDREVRAHEQAHQAVGGRYAGAASYQYKRGPDGVSYAVSGEVPISTGKEVTPEQTLLKAQIIRRAALAPAEPSPQDRRVAASAAALEIEARKEISLRQRQEQNEKITTGDDEENNSQPGNNGLATKGETREAVATSDNKSAAFNPALNLPGTVSGRLFRSIANSAINSHSPGSLLDKIA